MKYIWTRIIVAVWLSFMVATVGPALFGDMLLWTAPFTCAGGSVNVRTDVYYPRPGETDMTRTLLCTAADGSTSEVSTFGGMGVIWGYAFLPSLLIMFLIPSGGFGFLNQSRRYGGKDKDWAAEFAGPSHETLDRLGELNKAYEQKLITREEYDQKRKEVLKEV